MNQTVTAHEDTALIFRRLRALQRRFGARRNKNEFAEAMIGVCISEGLDTRHCIVGALRRLGLKEAHVVQVLAARTGATPPCTCGRWATARPTASWRRMVKASREAARGGATWTPPAAAVRKQ